MSRKQFLQKLLDKVDQGQQYLRIHINQNNQPQSPPPTIKRMQVMQMGQGRINMPNIIKKQQPIILSSQNIPHSTKSHQSKNIANKNNINQESCNPSPKTYCQISPNNQHNSHGRRIFVLQKVKCLNQRKKKQKQEKISTSKSQKNTLNKQHNVQSNNKNCLSIIKSIGNHLSKQFIYVDHRQPHQFKQQSTQINADEQQISPMQQQSDNQQQVVKDRIAYQKHIKITTQSKHWNSRNTTSHYPHPIQVNNYNKSYNFPGQNQQHNYSKSRTQIRSAFLKSIEHSNPSTKNIKSVNNYTSNYPSSLYLKNSIFKRKLSNNSSITVSNISNSTSPIKNHNKTYTNNKKYQEMQQQEKQNKLSLRQELRKTYTKKFAPPPKITAKYYVILEKQFIENFSPTSKTSHNSNQSSEEKNFNRQFTIKSHLSFNAKSSVQVASLTKIMTCIVAIDLCSRYGLDPLSQILKIGKFESNIGGTSARIKEGDIYTLEDMFHGLMLPSGNDASIAIGVWGGKVITGEGDINMAIYNLNTKEQYIQKSPTKKTKKHLFYTKFLEQMNKKAKQLNLTKSQYANTHGLINISNKSCAYDVAVLSMHAMQNQYFRKIVSTKNYQKTIQNQIKIKKQINNTNKYNQSITTNDQYTNNSIYSTSMKPKQYDSIKIKTKVDEKSINSKQQEEDQENSNQDEQKSEDISDTQSELKYQQTQFEDKDKVEQESWNIIKTTRTIHYENTHKLLFKPKTNYVGIKTGVTTSAGPCLCSCVRTPQGRQFYIVILNCKKMLMRFKETELLRKWLYKQQEILIPQINTRRYADKQSRNQFQSYDGGESEVDDDTLNQQQVAIDEQYD